MRNSTKLKTVLKCNTITLTHDGSMFEAIVTNEETGNSYICKGVNFTNLMNELIKDHNFYSKKDYICSENVT